MGKSGCVNSDDSERLGRKELAVMSVLWEDREQPRCFGVLGAVPWSPDPASQPAQLLRNKFGMGCPSCAEQAGTRLCDPGELQKE